MEILTIACPSDPVKVSPSGVPIPVSFVVPYVEGGLAPINITCEPTSGSTFSLGTTTVSCEAQDSLQQAARCSFNVSVKLSLGIARIVAFGDSITRGLMSGVIRSSDGVQSVQLFDRTKTYPFRLQSKLQNLFGPGSIVVINQGIDGEQAQQGLSRLSTVLAGLRPDTVLLMEGTNDLSRQRTQSEIMGVALTMERQVVEAKRQGVDPFLATIPPSRRYAHGLGAPILSDFLRAVAGRQNVPLVDIYTLLNEAQCRTRPFSFSGTFRSSIRRLPSLVQGACIGDDGLHPTAQGYELIAEEFFNRILEVYGSGTSRVSSTRLKTLMGNPGY